MVENFTSNYLEILRRNKKIDIITDGFVPIDTIHFSQSITPLGYSAPKAVFSRIRADDRIMADRDIKKIGEITSILKDFGLCIVSTKTGKDRWFRNQEVRYDIERVGYTKGVIVQSIPDGHEILWDRANNQFKLVGRNCRDDATKIAGATAWINGSRNN